MSNDIEQFLSAYVACALWSSHDNATPQGGEPFDANYTPDDIAPEALATMRTDCERFLRENANHLTDDNCYAGEPIERAGHDFWLTRNGHGAGFWDGDWREPAATALTDAAHAFGETDLYLGDDGKIYC